MEKTVRAGQSNKCFSCSPWKQIRSELWCDWTSSRDPVRMKEGLLVQETSHQDQRADLPGEELQRLKLSGTALGGREDVDRQDTRVQRRELHRCEGLGSGRTRRLETSCLLVLQEVFALEHPPVCSALKHFKDFH